METKHILALILFSAFGGGALLATTYSQRARDLAFLGMVCFSIFAEKFDVNFFGEYWYRGTSRGMGLSLTDVLAWSILASAAIAPKYPKRQWFWPASLGLLLIYFAYCTFSTVNALNPRFAMWELVNVPRSILIMLAGAAYLRTQREFGVLVLGLTFTVVVEAVFALKQRYLGGMYRVAGTLDHANSLSMYVCTVAPLLMAAAMAHFPTWLRWIAGIGCAAASISVMLTISRAGLPIFGFVMGGVGFFCMEWRVTRRKLIIALAIIGSASIVLMKSWDQIKARYAEASFAEEYLDTAGEGRGVYLRWASAIIDDFPLGAGLNNWSYIVSKTYGPRAGFWYEDYDDIKNDPDKADLPSIRYAAPAHSLAALTAGELGIPGLVIFGLLWLRWLQIGVMFLRRRLNPDPMHRLGIGMLFAVCGIFLQSTTEWVYRQSTLFLSFYLMLGGLASLHYARKHARVHVAEREPELEEIEIEATPIHASIVHERR
jgi:hypothetical protein